ANEAVRKTAERLVNVRGAVKSRPHSDVEGLIEDAAEFRCRQHLTPETDGADASGDIVVAEDLESRKFRECGAEPVAEMDFVFVDGVEPAFFDVIQPFDKARDAEDIGRATLEEIRIIAWLGGRRRVATGAAFAPGAERRSCADIQRTGTG